MKQLGGRADSLRDCPITLRVYIDGIGVKNHIHDLLPVFLS
jgi:hypothetical protein